MIWSTAHPSRGLRSEGLHIRGLGSRATDSESGRPLSCLGVYTLRFRLSGYRFCTRSTTQQSRVSHSGGLHVKGLYCGVYILAVLTLESLRGLHSRGLHFKDLESRATSFGSGLADHSPVWGFTPWGPKVSGYRFGIWSSTYPSLRIIIGDASTLFGE